MNQLVWRWHFICALVFLPLIFLLSVTGALYLFNDEYEEIIYSDLLYINDEQVHENKLSGDAILEIVKEAYPNYIAQIYISTDNRERSTEVIIKKKSNFKSSQTTPTPQVSSSGWQIRDEDAPDRLSIFVDPYSGQITGVLDNNTRFMNVVKTLHGDLLTGEFGTKFVELAASWTIVMVITGLFLWFPRRASQGGLFFPRLHSGSKQTWRDIHAITGFYFAFPLLFLLLSGLPWTDVWGNSFKEFKNFIGQSASTSFFDRSIQSDYYTGAKPIGLDAVLKIAKQQDISGKLKIRLPIGKTGAYNLLKDEDDPVRRVLLQVDQYNGYIISEVRWEDTPFIEKVVSICIKIHRGEYFGRANQLLGLATALALMLICLSGFLVWHKRRPTGTLGIPARLEQMPMPKWMIGLTIFFAIFLPLLGASLILFFIVEFATRKIRSYRGVQS